MPWPQNPRSQIPRLIPGLMPGHPMRSLMPRRPCQSPAAKAPDPKVPDARTAALIALLQAAGLLRKLFPAADRSRVMKLTTGYWPSLAVEDELRLTRLAMEEEATL